MNLQRAVQLCVDIAALLVVSKNLQSPSNMAEAFVRLRENAWITEDVERTMRAAVGFRNIAVNEYRALDWLIVHRIASKHLNDFKRSSASS